MSRHSGQTGDLSLSLRLISLRLEREQIQNAEKARIPAFAERTIAVCRHMREF
jgi:hypothetical protein